MNPKAVGLTASALLALLLAAPAQGGEGGSEFSFEPRLENIEDGARFHVTGSLPRGYPDGASVHVTLMVEGRSRAPVRASFLKVNVLKGRFVAEFSWKGQRLAPMTYRVEVVLYLDEQGPEARKEFVREFGWANGHIEKLGSQEVEFGTLEERSSFGQKSLGELRGLVERYDQLRQRALAAFSEGNVEPVQAELVELEKELVAFKRAYVVRVEGELIQRLDSANASVFRHIRRGGARAKSGLEQLAQELKLIITEIEARTALKPAGELEGEGQPGEGEPRPGEEERQ